MLSDTSVSRTHGKISVVGDDRYLLEDLGSQNGTFVRSPTGWQSIRHAEVRSTDELRFGLYVTTVAALMQRIAEGEPRARLERNPDTGEIVRPGKER